MELPEPELLEPGVGGVVGSVELLPDPLEPLDEVSDEPLLPLLPDEPVESDEPDEPLEPDVDESDAPLLPLLLEPGVADDPELLSPELPLLPELDEPGMVEDPALLPLSGVVDEPDVPDVPLLPDEPDVSELPPAPGDAEGLVLAAPDDEPGMALGEVVLVSPLLLPGVLPIAPELEELDPVLLSPLPAVEPVPVLGDGVEVPAALSEELDGLVAALPLVPALLPAVSAPFCPQPASANPSKAVNRASLGVVVDDFILSPFTGCPIRWNRNCRCCLNWKNRERPCCPSWNRTIPHCPIRAIPSHPIHRKSRMCRSDCRYRRSDRRHGARIRRRQRPGPARRQATRLLLHWWLSS